jgi:hypothetical protein
VIGGFSMMSYIQRKAKSFLAIERLANPDFLATLEGGEIVIEDLYLDGPMRAYITLIQLDNNFRLFVGYSHRANDVAPGLNGQVFHLIDYTLRMEDNEIHLTDRCGDRTRLIPRSASLSAA